LTQGQRAISDFGAIACWLVLWGILVTLGMALGSWVASAVPIALGTALWPLLLSWIW